METENKQRNDIFLGDDVVYSYEDLQLGVKGDLKQLLPGRRAQLTLGDQWDAQYSYQAVLLDAKDLSESFLYQFGVFLVPAVSKKLIVWSFCVIVAKIWIIQLLCLCMALRRI